MKKYFFLIALSVLSACGGQSLQTEAPELCTDPWCQWIESAIRSGDGLGHGPDIGSEEWKSVVEFKLGVRGHVDVPDRNSLEWCRYIDDVMKRR